MHWHIDNLHKQTDKRKAHESHNQVSQKQTDENRIYIRRLLNKQQWSRLQTLHHQRAHHNRRRTVTGNAQRQHRNESAAGNSIIACLRSDNALRLTIAEVFAVLRPALSLVIRNERRNIAACTRHTANERANAGGTHQRRKNTLDIIKGRQQSVELHMLLTAFIMIIFLNAAQHLRESKHTNQHRDEGHAA